MAVVVSVGVAEVEAVVALAVASEDVARLVLHQATNQSANYARKPGIQCSGARKILITTSLARTRW
jgi:hypothetical protein